MSGLTQSAMLLWNSSTTVTGQPFIFSTRASAMESSTRSESINAFSEVLSTEGRVVGLFCAELKPKGPKHPNRATLYLLHTSLCTGEPNAIRTQKSFPCSPFYGRACRWAMFGEIKT